jgi:putative membrane protein
MKIKDLLNLRENPYYRIIKNPKIYFYNIGVSTIIVGVITLGINLLHMYTPLSSIKIPTGIHQLIGFLIAMLLVFRTNTAYDRWWEGRKMLDIINSKTSNIVTILNTNSEEIRNLGEIKSHIIDFLTSIKTILKNPVRDINPDLHKLQMDWVSSIMRVVKELNRKKSLTDQEYNAIINCLMSILEAISSCERIKTTPIPFSYYIHIKISIFLYLITLPFSLFVDMHLWSTLVVMVLYFLISGVEIISSEIENPFSGEPNDLPVDDIIESIKKSVV